MATARRKRIIVPVAGATESAPEGQTYEAAHGMAIMYAPGTQSSFSDNGQEYAVDENGYIEIPAQCVGLARAHGFVDPPLE